MFVGTARCQPPAVFARFTMCDQLAGAAVSSFISPTEVTALAVVFETEPQMGDRIKFLVKGIVKYTPRKVRCLFAHVQTAFSIARGRRPTHSLIT